MRGRRIFEAEGAALLFMLQYFIPFLLPGNAVLLHRRLALSNVVGALLLDLLIFTVLGWAILALLRKLPEMPRCLASAILAGILLYRAAGTLLALIPLWLNSSAEGSLSAIQNTIPAHLGEMWAAYAHLLLLLGSSGLIALSFLSKRTLKYIVRSVLLGLSAISFSSLWIVPHLFWLAAAPHHRTPNFDHSSTQSSPKIDRRIIWILFDELSYKLILEHPPYEHEFSNFARFHSRSTSFSNIEPVAFFTERVIPSLLAGHEVADVRSGSGGELLEPESSRTSWHTYDPNQTLFAQAQAQGWYPGVVGWYIPYCRYFEENLTTCMWEPGIYGKSTIEQMGASNQNSIWANALVIPQWYLSKKFSSRQESPMRVADIYDYQRVTSAAKNVINNGQVRFIFIHLPVPHPPGIFNRKTHQLCACGNYLDNLWLADDTLGMLQKEIDKTPWAGKTTVIVSSDHSWRIPIWSKAPDWTAEEHQFAQGGFDHRPVFMVHFPGQKAGEEMTMPTSELMEHDIVAAMLKQQITSAERLRTVIQAGAGSNSDAAHNRPWEPSIPSREP